MSESKQVSGYSGKEANRMKILADLKAKEEKEKKEKLLKELKAKKQAEKIENEKKEAEALALKRAKRKKAIKSTCLFSFIFSLLSFLIFVPKVDQIEYKALSGNETVFIVKSDILGFYDSQVIDNSWYDSVNINELKGKISFCSTKHKEVNCYDTQLIERKNSFISFFNYLSYLKNKFF